MFLSGRKWIVVRGRRCAPLSLARRLCRGRAAPGDQVVTCRPEQHRLQQGSSLQVKAMVSLFSGCSYTLAAPRLCAASFGVPSRLRTLCTDSVLQGRNRLMRGEAISDDTTLPDRLPHQPCSDPCTPTRPAQLPRHHRSTPDLLRVSTLTCHAWPLPSDTVATQQNY